MKDFTKISISERARCLLKPRKLQVAAEADKLLNEIVPVLYSLYPHSQYTPKPSAP